MADANFHFLVNALPDVSSMDVESINDVRWLIEANLDKVSLRAFRFILHRNDNKNLLKLMRKRDGLLPRTAEHFYTPAVFSFEDLDDMLIDAYEDDAEIPAYMTRFLAEERTAGYTVRERENRLLELYYDEGTVFPQEFVRSMFLFKRDLKNVLLALNARMQGFKITRITVGDYDLPDHLAASNQADFGLAGVHEYIPRLSQLLADGQLVELEHLLDELLLSNCEEVARGDLFSLNFVLHYFLDLSLRHRWHDLTPEKGARALTELVQDIIRGAGEPGQKEVDQV